MKKIYSKPEILVVESQIECSILAGSGKSADQSFGESTNQRGFSVINQGVADNGSSDGSVFGKRTGGDLWE